MKIHSQVITFTDAWNSNGVMLEPVPASKLIPDWYKKQNAYLNNVKEPTDSAGTTATIKKCMPVFDSMNLGYLLLLPADVYVSQKDGLPFYKWMNFDLISFHPVEQADKHPLNNGVPFAKFINPWAIKTPKGYSCLFVEPFHSNLPFTSMAGVVDTDKYTAPVNIVFVLKDPNFTGLIPKGTPIAQVIPFKRNKWKMAIGKKSDLDEQFNVSRLLNTVFFDRYKTMFRVPKEFK
jgi:hypothetical protein